MCAFIGCGKTLIAIKVLEEMKNLNPGRRVVLFVPTGPLVSQQAAYIRRESNLEVLELSGQHGTLSATATNPLEGTKVVDALVVTPQYFLNMVYNKRTDITDYSAMVFDEAHHATGKHPYREILEKLAAVDLAVRPRILGLTASPFGESSRDMASQLALKKLTESFNCVLNAPTLFTDELEQSFIPKEAKWVLVDETEHESMLRSALKKYIDSFFSDVSRLSGGNVVPFGTNYDCDDTELSQFLAKLRVSQRNARPVNKPASNQTGEAPDQPPQGSTDKSDLELLLEHMRKIASSFYDLSLYGPSCVAKSLFDIFQDLTGKTTAGSKKQRKFDLVRDKYLSTLHPVLVSFPHEEYDGADIATRVHLVAECIRNANFTHESRAIVFVRRRRTAILLAKAMEGIEELRELNPTRFVGHNSYEGMSWEEEQKPTLERFRQGRIRLLVATNVLEEGLDVPECSLVVQFDGIIGVTSLIQSRGRARQRHSDFVILCSQAGKEHSERLVEHEKRLIMTARLVAESLPSKAVVERLIHVEDTVDSREDGSQDSFEQEASSLTSQLTNLQDSSAVTYSVVIGGASASVKTKSHRPEEVFMRRLTKVAEFASVVIVDQAVGLCTLKTLADNDIFQSYSQLCDSVKFALSETKRGETEPPFWMRFESMEKYAASNNATDGCNITDVTLQRGMFTPRAAFVQLSRYPNSGVLEVGSRLVRVAFPTTRQRVEFDLRALSDFTVRLNWEPKSTVDIHLSCALPPLFFTGNERECVNCQFRSQQYVISIPKLEPNLESLWQLRSHFVKYGVEVHDTWVPETSFPAEDATQAPFERLLELPIAYGLQCFLSGHSFFLDGTLPPEFFDILDGLSPRIQAEALTAFRPTPELGSVVEQFKGFVEREAPVMESLVASAHLNKGSVVYKTIVTPTRIVFCPPEPAPNNRVFRHWGAENFMYVYFRDENMERLDYTDVKLLERIRKVMLDGITINNAHGDLQNRSRGLMFRFLGCSLSQVRNSSAVFTLLDPHAVREWVGDFSHITSPAKYLKRLGQAFSATREAFLLDQSVLDHPVDDIANEQYVFTDGCGEISVKGAEEIVAALKLSYLPSAFQIRVAGAKGVVVVSDRVDNDVSENSIERSVVLRKSMSKFSSSHRMLEVVAYSVRSDAFLTRQSIQLLSDLGIEESVFLEMQEDYLDELRSLLASDATAYFQLKDALPPSTVWWIDILVRELGVKILLDEFLFSMVRTIYNYRMTNTLLRARIPVAKGRTMMGVADFTGTLKYGEVFVQYSELDETTGIERLITLSDIDVVVHRSPCHHPGDVRVLKCRSDVPDEMKHLRDCVVFPCEGPRPHPDECTGGDLDGDVFVVIWDERLIPARANVQEPMEFDATTPEASDRYESTDDACLIDFYINSIRDDILGIASNAHLALCDKAEDGSFNENAKLLARICSKQVDSLRAETDLEIVRKYMPKEYPDFMQSRDRPSYPSSGVLGKMYRRCTALMDSSSSGHHMKPIGFLHMDDEFLINGYQNYVPGAEVVYQQYKLRLLALLNMSGASTEAELLTGMIVEPPSIHKANYFRFGDQCKDAFFRLQDAFSAQFEEEYGSLLPAEHCKVAAAWYYVAYNDIEATTDSDVKESGKGGSRGRFLSFPFILIKYLVQNKANVIRDPQSRIWTPIRRNNFKETAPKLQLALLAEIVTNSEELLSGLFDRLVAVSSLRSSMPPHLTKKNLDLILFGSSALLTFEKQSDLDVLVLSSAQHGKRGTLAVIAEHLIKTARDRHANHDVDLKENIRVPLLSFSSDKWSIEMCQLSNGPLKTRLFRAYIAKYAFFWPCLYFLVRWSKCVGIVRRRGGGGNNLFAPIGMTWLFLTFCIQHKYVEPIHIGEITLPQIVDNYSIDSEIAFWTALLTGLVSGTSTSEEMESEVLAADVLLSFLSYFGKLSTPTTAYAFTDPYDVDNDTQLDVDGITCLRAECYRAFHELVISKGDVHSLLTDRADQVSVVTLSRALSRRLREAKDFFSRKILMDAKAESSAQLVIKFHSNALRSDLYVAEIRGDGMAVQRVEERIRSYEQELGAPMSHASKGNFHREGASLLLFEGALSQHEMIGFQDYFGRHHVEHSNMRLHQAHLICFMNGQEWYDHAALTFSAKFVEQMVKLSRYEHLTPSASTAKAFIRFGHHYLIHLPRSFDEETIVRATIKKLEDDFERGRTARELFESVMIAKRKQREAEEEEQRDAKVADDEDDRQDRKPGAWSDDAGGRDGDGGGDDDGCDERRDGDQEVDGHYDDYDDYDDVSGSESDSDEKSPPNGRGKRPQRRLSSDLNLRSADSLARTDKGVTHSFFTMVDPIHERWTRAYALEKLGLTLVRSAENYQVSVIHESFDYNVRLSADLQLEKVTTRPARWFSATVKMHQELDEESETMDATPDMRFYVTLAEEVPATHPLNKLLARCCRGTSDGRGIIDFVNQETRDNLRISDAMKRVRFTPASIPTVRHIHSETFRCAAEGESDLQFTVMQVREFGIPSRDASAGYLTVREHSEVEFLMPLLTPERRLRPEFAREFLATGLRFVEFLRAHQSGLLRDDM